LRALDEEEEPMGAVLRQVFVQSVDDVDLGPFRWEHGPLFEEANRLRPRGIDTQAASA
jgi:hypothetical protein